MTSLVPAGDEPVTIDERQRKKLLRLVAKEQTIGTVVALRKAGVQGTKGQLRQLVENDDELRRDLDEARGRGPETIRAEIKRRAIDGVEEPVYTPSGKLAGTRRIYSDRLLALMARANLPEYRDVQRHEHTGPDGRPIEVQQTHVIDLHIARLVDELAGRREAQAALGPPPGALEASGETGADAA